MELAVIMGAYNSLKVAKEMFTGVFASRVDEASRPIVNAALEEVSHAQTTIFQMRDELFRLQGVNEELRRKQAAIDSWAETSAQFKMDKTPGGAYVYKHLGEPMYYACPSCFNKKEILPLQDNRTHSGIYRCVSCEATYPIEPRRANPASQALTYPGTGII